MYLYIFSRVNILVYLNTNFFILNESFQCLAYFKAIIGEISSGQTKRIFKNFSLLQRGKRKTVNCFVSEKQTTPLRELIWNQGKRKFTQQREFILIIYVKAKIICIGIGNS